MPLYWPAGGEAALTGVKKVDQTRKNKVFNLFVVLPATEDLLGLLLDVYVMLYEEQWRKHFSL